jgi:cytochrome P450
LSRGLFQRAWWILDRIILRRSSKVARDDVTFSRSGLAPPTDVGRLLPIMADPPELARYRALLYPFLSPAAVKELEPFIRSMIDRCIADFIEHGRADLVMDLANPVPAGTTIHMLGLDCAEWRYFAEPFMRSCTPPRVRSRIRPRSAPC